MCGPFEFMIIEHWFPWTSFLVVTDPIQIDGVTAAATRGFVFVNLNEEPLKQSITFRDLLVLLMELYEILHVHRSVVAPENNRNFETDSHQTFNILRIVNICIFEIMQRIFLVLECSGKAWEDHYCLFDIKWHLLISI